MSRQVEEYGQVSLVQHPLVSVEGLPSVQVGELVQFESGSVGQVFTLGIENCEVLVFSSEPVEAGETATRTGRMASIALSPSLIGATITPLGELGESVSMLTLEQAQKPTATVHAEVDHAPPLLTERRRITELLFSGVSMLDLVLPIGKGQRELLVGDHKTGKTSLALQIAEAQVQRGALVVYAAIGKLGGEIKRVQQHCLNRGMQDSVTIVASTADDPPTVIYQTPFTALAVAEYFNSLGRDVVVILDDLTTHARYYREIALLSKRFPGRDSYPGDIFYTHARLLERAGCFVHPTAPDQTVSISCLPIAETTESELTDYIVSNLISITDGHWLFDAQLYFAGRRPAINPSLSVTRVGKQTQQSLQRDLGQTLTAFINRYQKTVNLSHFGAELSAETKEKLAQGAALFAFLNQDKDRIFASSVMLTISGAIFLNWFADASPKEIQGARDLLQEQYQKSKQVQTELATFEQAETVEELLRLLKKEQKNITALWQPKSK